MNRLNKLFAIFLLTLISNFKFSFSMEAGEPKKEYFTFEEKLAIASLPRPILYKISAYLEEMNPNSLVPVLEDKSDRISRRLESLEVSSKKRILRNKRDALSFLRGKGINPLARKAVLSGYNNSLNEAKERVDKCIDAISSLTEVLKLARLNPNNLKR